MKRSEFLQSIGLGSVGLLLPTSLLAKSKVKIYDNYVRGLSHYQYKNVKNKLSENDQLDLKRDSDNVHDQFAVEVTCQNQKLGYIAAYENICIANLLDGGVELFSFVSFHDKTKSNYQNIGIEVYVELITPTKQLITELQNKRADEVVDIYRKGYSIKK